MGISLHLSNGKRVAGGVAVGAANTWERQTAQAKEKQQQKKNLKNTFATVGVVDVVVADVVVDVSVIIDVAVVVFIALFAVGWRLFFSLFPLPHVRQTRQKKNKKKLKKR